MEARKMQNFCKERRVVA